MKMKKEEHPFNNIYIGHHKTISSTVKDRLCSIKSLNESELESILDYDDRNTDMPLQDTVKNAIVSKLNRIRKNYEQRKN